MARLPAERLDDILVALARIERRLAAAGIQRGEALDDESLSILAWNLLVAGEAIKALPAAMIARHPAVDWRGLAGLRDRLAHQYFQIDQQLLWKIVAYDLPPLRAAVSEELDRPGDDVTGGPV
jgi:uncharacterized protein with HEPN domain